MAATTQITARVPDRLIREIDRTARRLRRTRAELVRRAIEYYLDDLEDLRTGLAALQDPADAVLDWADVRRALLGQD
jgi:predicted DNA-binding protein